MCGDTVIGTVGYSGTRGCGVCGARWGMKRRMRLCFEYVM